MNTKPLVPAPTGSPTPSPNDHLRLLVELLKPAGVELGRRWMAALMLVPESSREQIVSAVEARIVAEFGPGNVGGGAGEAGAPVETGGPGKPPSLLTSVGRETRRGGFSERLETTYEVVGDEAATEKRKKKRA